MEDESELFKEVSIALREKKYFSLTSWAGLSHWERSFLVLSCFKTSKVIMILEPQMTYEPRFYTFIMAVRISLRQLWTVYRLHM